MTKAIIWKEWKRSRMLYIAFVVAAVVIPALPAHFFPNEGETARLFIQFVWYLFSISVGWLFGEQSRRGSLPFLLARPATKPYLFCAHYLSYLIALAALIVVTLSVHYFHMAFRFPGFSPLEIVFEPGLVFSLATCLLLFSFSLFIANSFVTFGSTTMGIVFIVLLVLTFIVLFVLPELDGATSAARGAASRHAYSPALGLDETPLLFLFLMFSASVIFASLSLWEISFDELRDARNRKWIAAVATASVLAVVLLIGSISAVASAMKRPSASEFRQVFAGLSLRYDVKKGVLAVTDDGVYVIRTQFAQAHLKDAPLRKMVSTTEQPFTLITQYPKGLAYRSEKPFWGQEIRRLDPSDGGVETISQSRYSEKRILGDPFISPDRDRFAFLETVKPRFGGKIETRLWIAKLDSVSDYVELPGDPETTTWEPIGWTPDGYDFMLRRRQGGKSEMWAVDWVARGPIRFLEEHPDAIITRDDLPGNGGWISLLEKTPDGKWNLQLVDYRSGESKSLGILESRPLRAWAADGLSFAYWEPTTGVNTYHTGKDVSLNPAKHSDAGTIVQMRWSPIIGKLTLVAEVAKAGRRLILLDVADCEATILVEDFPADDRQWDWLDGKTLVYADGGDLWMVDLDGERTPLFSLASLQGSG